MSKVIIHLADYEDHIELDGTYTLTLDVESENGIDKLEIKESASDGIAPNKVIASQLTLETQAKIISAMMEYFEAYEFEMYHEMFFDADGFDRIPLQFYI